MRCKKHFPVDVSSAVGVCASCLRERLSSFIHAETWPNQIEDRRPPEVKPLRHQPPQLVFPRSVSPYKTRRSSDRSEAVDDYLSHRNLQQIRFFSTPQVDLTVTKKNKKSKFHAISNLFRSRSAKSAPPPSDSISGFIYPSAVGRKKSPLRLFSLNETSIFDGQRGMSPEADDSDSDAESVSPIRFGCSPEPWKKTPISTRASHVRAKASPARSHVASGIGICLSPLMRPSPMRQWNGKGVGPGGSVESSVHSGETRSTMQPHLSAAGTFCSNRSRKLADFGKFNHNR